MQIIILGTKKAEICKVWGRNQNKELFLNKKQLYRIFPQNLKRCQIIKWGRDKGHDEIEIYQENMTIPTIVHGNTNYTKNAFFALIRNKMVKSSHGIFSTKAINYIRKLPEIIAIIFAVGLIIFTVIQANW